ncbi:unnamed protein product [Spirodela intermedia]|uniref:Homeobox domain-containing protein n=1 Tax=Spirodela intermedia TaxID=51605 RepID=A0A7I8I7D0_SPIIN|nr:unnamed protein product [Spirodela intermedia]CAA6653465.1 unnamed protein product [Spirodela intermedia]
MEGQGLSLSLSSSLQQLEMAQQVGYVGSVGMGNMIRHPKYAKATQELLQEFCSAGMGLLKKGKKGKHFGSLSTEPNPSSSNAVDRRYSHYTEKMQAMVSSFDSAMGFGAAAPYTGLARRAMSRHFRCLKDAIAAQLKHVGGDSQASAGRPDLRQQRTFNQYGVVEQESWRPQRGLPERSVNVLRAWLFEHFLHPYPSDADKHFLARQTGLSRSQVSNWFINARVRLWKPMVEEMYQREANEATEAGEGETAASESTTQPQPRHERPEDMAGGTGLPHPSSPASTAAA